MDVAKNTPISISTKIDCRARNRTRHVRYVHLRDIGVEGTLNLSLIELGNVMLRNIVRRSLEALRVIPRSEFMAEVQAFHPTPEQLRPGKLFIVRDDTLDKWIWLRCPCGCGAKVQLSMDRNRRPLWSAKVDWLGRPTIEPPIRRLDECRCHFWLNRGQIQW